ncbi:putative metalloprotease CJM1_0395 family protein [Methylicorpusculum sp.]|uniref:putative metalloprotease CJM1_0395 family protein n=1 Tax=Methylicorpusculum sp. TaxID=2713644 RepID=UPI0027208E18|nr:putative metalloprotease CJM1_0395 family protein [Methylicorpusculum sp.]MDO8844801.1 putative metalloprotease CJM1_0395 family protein [Methylicorpusculum sp.]
MLTSVSMHQISNWPGMSPEKTHAHEKNAGASSTQEKLPQTGTSASPEAQDIETIKVIESLKARDREVRAHEQAHISASGGLATGGASFTYQQGPDGKRYAIGGEVNIDTSPVPGDPRATLRKAETIRRAALAPANPSGQDYKVASKAAQMATKAQMDLIKLQQATQSETASEEKPSLKIDVTA